MLFTSLLTSVTIALSLSARGNEDCCGCPARTPPSISGPCWDGTPCTPCCDYGLVCNVFCCNCDNGCRSGSKQLNALEKASSLNEDSSGLFAAADTNGDGKMTFAEWRDSPLRSTPKAETNEMLSEIWAKYDVANVGYLTKEKAINRKPSA